MLSQQAQFRCSDQAEFVICRLIENPGWSLNLYSQFQHAMKQSAALRHRSRLEAGAPRIAARARRQVFTNFAITGFAGFSSGPRSIMPNASPQDRRLVRACASILAVLHKSPVRHTVRTVADKWFLHSNRNNRTGEESGPRLLLAV